MTPFKIYKWNNPKYETFSVDTVLKGICDKIVENMIERCTIGIKLNMRLNKKKSLLRYFEV